MPFFEGSHNFIVNGGNFMDATRLNGLQYLAQNIASQATHDSPASRERPVCHPETRSRVLDQIVNWATNKDDPTTVFWLYGPAGVGKSAIAQTIAVRLSTLGVLGATFFFSRTDSTRNTVSQLFLTIAYQLAISWHSMALRTEIEKVIERDPNVINQRMELQWEKLIIGPIRNVLPDTSDNFMSTLIIIIDGLDECLNETEQVDVLKLLNSGGLPIRIVISSRPEPHLFDSVLELNHFNCYNLLRTTEVDEEIKIYLRDEFRCIQNRKKYRAYMQRASAPWPSDEILEKLVNKASGHFIYASTVINYIQSRNESPIALLNHILHFQDSHGPGAFAELDMLYQGILAKSLEAEDLIDRTLSILGLMLLLLREERSILLPTLSVIEQLLQLDPGEIGLAMDGLQSLIHIPDLTLLSTWDIQEPYFHHASLEDFLTDETRSGKYFIDLKKVSYKLISCCANTSSGHSIQWKGHLHTPAYSGHNSNCNLFGWYYSLSTWLDIHRSQPFENIEFLEEVNVAKKWIHANSILESIFNLLNHPRDFGHSEHNSEEEMRQQLAHNPSLEAFIVTASIIISRIDIATQTNIDIVSQVDVKDRQAFADLLDFLTCNPYINKRFRAVLFGYLSEFLHSKIVPSSYFLPHPVEWEETAFAQGIFAKVFVGIYKTHKVCIRKDMRYYRNIDKALYRKLPHPILTSRHLIHPNLIPFYGAEIHPPLEADDWYSHPVLDWAICAIVPYMEGGNILQYLSKIHPCEPTVYWLLISDIVSALQYVNSNQMIIQSWSTEGILVSANGRAYLTGFQSSLYSFHEDLTWNIMEERTMEQLKTLVRYSAPEILNSGVYTLTMKSTIFSFATICFEILTKIVPFFEESPDIDAITKRVIGGVHPTRPVIQDKCWSCNGGPMSEEDWNLLLECWNLDPKKRPDINEIYTRLLTKDTPDMRPKDEWEPAVRFNDLQYNTQFITPGAITTLFSLLPSTEGGKHL